MSIASILIALILVCLVLWGVQRLLAAFSVPEPFNTVIWVAVVILCVLWMVSALFGVSYFRLT
jgi:hypothetical protein